jgi:hypothetical protein
MICSASSSEMISDQDRYETEKGARAQLCFGRLRFISQEIASHSLCDKTLRLDAQLADGNINSDTVRKRSFLV